MSFFQPQLSKTLIVCSLLLGMTAQVSAADAEAPNTDELYEYLFPEARGSAHVAAAPSAVPGASAPAPRPMSAFRDQNRRASWSEDQIQAMKGAFKAKEPAPVERQIAGAVAVPAQSSPFDAASVSLGDRPFADLIQVYAAKRNLNPRLVSMMVKQESRSDPNAISPKGAQGLMQLMPDLSKQFNIDPFDPEMNIKVGTQYFADLLAKYGQVELALAAYNAGPGAVDKYGGIPPFSETQNYVSTIMAGVAQLEANNQ
ncbi:lytic transglycosylase domain-containing protein (plasmid) [Pseudomonas sp. G.S.17]|uniref:lytic transglycosylase domain-containing protein n=1 Tax=Pseudomonas sp. G.S.17 TaxID=3137451 RepID=UPI00311CB02A